METQNLETILDMQNTVITPTDLLNHWQGHRRVTRRVIEAFPEKELFSYSIGGMRTFAELVNEMLAMAVPGMKGVVTRSWDQYNDASGLDTKEGMLKRWDEATSAINEYWTQIPAGRFQEVDVAFGQWKGRIHETLSYFIDNEIHHRGQGYVYLRSLGIEPPAFWDRN
ncbi:MAG TPA: DinB family protein [Chryseolinea sp.]|nr:DinB family protein [Chryseolinea sp.]